MASDLDVGIGSGWRCVGLGWDDGSLEAAWRITNAAQADAATEAYGTKPEGGEGSMGRHAEDSEGKGLRGDTDGDSATPVTLPPIPYSAMRWGNVDFSTLSHKRDPSPADTLFLVDEYKRTGHIDACAKRANLDYDVAWKVIQDEIRKNPQILESGEVSLSMGLACREIAMEAVIAARTKLRDPRIKAGDAMWTHKIAIDRADANFKEYRSHEGDAIKTDPGELERALKEKEDELRQLEGTGTASANAEDKDSASVGEVPGAMGKDS